MAARRWVVRGRVQGVGFRYFVHREAVTLGVTGWVRNLDDGRVEVFGQGRPAVLDDLERRVWRGPRGAEVRDVEVIEAAVAADCTAFRIEHLSSKR